MDWPWFIRQRILRPHLLLRDIWWKIRYRTTDRNHMVPTGLKPGYWDSDSLMLHAAFSLLVRYVEIEKPFDHFDWDRDDEHRRLGREIRQLYHWWTELRANRRDPLDDLSDEERPKPMEGWKRHLEGGTYWDDTCNQWQAETYPRYNRLLKESADLEMSWDQEDEDMLVRLVKIRRFLWT